VVTINGLNLGGVTAVSFGGTAAASFIVNSATKITATLGSGSTGKISLTAPGGTAVSSSSFTFLAPEDDIHSITLTDSDLPAPPVSGMTFHFLAPSDGDFGPAKIRLSYGGMSWAIWLGVEDGKLWVYHLPPREAVPASLLSFYDSLGINQYTTLTPDGRYWLKNLPPWINLAKYDPDLTGLPVLVSIASTSGQLVLSYTVD